MSASLVLYSWVQVLRYSLHVARRVFCTLHRFDTCLRSTGLLSRFSPSCCFIPLVPLTWYTFFVFRHPAPATGTGIRRPPTAPATSRQVLGRRTHYTRQRHHPTRANMTRLKCCACHAKWRWRSPKCCACHEKCNSSCQTVAQVLRLPHTRRLLTRYEWCWDVTTCHACHAKRGHATIETSRSDPFCRMRYRHCYTGLARTVCEQLRTAAEVSRLLHKTPFPSTPAEPSPN